MPICSHRNRRRSVWEALLARVERSSGVVAILSGWDVSHVLAGVHIPSLRECDRGKDVRRGTTEGTTPYTAARSESNVASPRVGRSGGRIAGESGRPL